MQFSFDIEIWGHSLTPPTKKNTKRRDCHLHDLGLFTTVTEATQNIIYRNIYAARGQVSALMQGRGIPA